MARTPNSQLPTPNSQLPTPNPQPPTPNSQLPLIRAQQIVDAGFGARLRIDLLYDYGTV